MIKEQHRAKDGATGRSRTDDLRFTKPLLYQLSYRGERGAFFDFSMRMTPPQESRLGSLL
jgi:hypothetical protein